MAKRVYSESIKKWAAGIGISGVSLVGLIFTYLFLVGAISNVSYSGDYVCAGTIEDPCYAYINFTAEEDIFIYPTNYDPWGRNTLFNFNPKVKFWRLERSWGDGWRNIQLNKSCTGTWCGLSNSEDERKFSMAFREDRDYQIRIVAYKNNPNDIIKWGAFSGIDEIDPTWLASDWITNSLLTNVTAESGDANFTHLNVSNTAPYDSLVGYWSADGDLADTKLTKAYDWSGEGNDGTMGGDTVATSSAGKFGKGFSFDGAGDYIYLTTFNTLYNQNQTWSFWIKKLESKKQIFFDVKDSNNVRLLTAGEYLGNLVISRTNTLSTAYTIHGDNIDTGWHNVILVYNSSNDSNRFRIFVDGVDTSSSASSYFGTRGAASQMKIGGRLDSTSYFNGSIDDVMFFNTSLTSDQISDIYNNQSARHKSTGTQDIINQNYMNISSGNNKVNVSTNIQNNLGSGINLSVGYYDGSWHSTSSQVIVSGVNNTFDISSTSTNLTLNYTFIAGDYDFYSPILEGDIEFEAWSEEELGENPSVVFDETTDYGETNENYFFVNVTASDVGRGVGNVSTFVDLNNSLIAWWRMDDGNATNVFDYFGEYNGTLQNTPTKVTGVLGDAYQFDNDSLDYIDFGDMSVAEDKTFTYTLWMKTIQDSSGAYIMSEGNTINDAPLVAIYLYNGKVVGAIRNDTYGAVNLYSTFDVNDDEWHFVAYTSGDTYSRLYVDGIEEASNIAGSGTITLDTMSLGALRRGSVVSYFNGSIDDVTVWDRDLSFEEVVGLYANQSTKYMENIYDNLNAGTYNFTAYAQNTAGNINKTEEKSILVNAIDASPYFLDIPENSTLETGESLEVDFRATDGNFNKGVWTWFNSPVAIESNNQTFIGWVNSNGDVVIFQYNKTNQEKSSYILSYAFEVDDHANPAITILPNGKILVTWSKHGYKSYYRVSVNPYNISSWTARTEMPNNPPGVTNVAYSNAFYLGNEDLVYNYYRYNESGIAFSKYNYTNDSWTSATSMLSDSEVQTAVNRTYTQFWSDDNDTIHFFATNGHPGYKQTDVFHMYYKNGNYYQTNGTLIGGDEVLPLSTSDITPIDTNSYKTWTSDIKVFDDMPYVVYPTYADINNITYVFGRWNQSEDTWQIFNITGSEGTGLYSPEIHYGVDYYTAGITIDEYDPSIVYLGSNVTGIYEIEQWETDDNGETWVKTKNITKDSTYHNFRPYTIKNASDELNLLWVGDGLYTSFAEYDTNIVSNQIDLDINHAVKYYVDDTTNFTIDINYGILKNKTALSIGTYILNVSINDSSGNSAFTIYQVDVINLDINYSSNIGNIRFVNCSPDWEFYPTYPSGQTDSISSINATNNGTAVGDFQIEYIGSLSTGWTLFSCNDSSSDPYNDGDCITLSDSFQTIWNSVNQDDTKRIWLYGNCSMVSSNPGVVISMQAA